MAFSSAQRADIEVILGESDLPSTVVISEGAGFAARPLWRNGTFVPGSAILAFELSFAVGAAGESAADNAVGTIAATPIATMTSTWFNAQARARARRTNPAVPAPRRPSP